MLFDRDGNRMTPSHAVGTGGRALVTVEKARKSGFASDSPLEEAGFEPSVPL
jgi:hypothetical protein